MFSFRQWLYTGGKVNEGKKGKPVPNECRSYKNIAYVVNDRNEEIS